MRLPATLIAASLFFAPGIAAAQSAITLKDPKAFEQQLTEMGYAPEPFGAGTDTVETVLHLPNETLGVVLAGCTNGKGCTYAVLLGSFSDLHEVPADWVTKMNVNFDLIKVWVRDDKKLAYSAGAIIEGLPRSTFRAWVENIVDSSNSLANEAIKAGLIAK
ncbi:MAG: hypothetical protein P0Y59_19605 [Candidatus Sphingomonas phytovorans]|nr:hypothetical protein [Sphingomonas sp.]WEJ99125.1 MAG: hypothetical protein P0Y59_19605 [Sphingomonas sp.]